MPSKLRREGYLVIDHRNSPGVPAELVRASGLNAPIVERSALHETATFSCAHCGTPFTVPIVRGRTISYCRKCDQYVCDNPACNSECTPFLKTLDRLQEQAFHLQSQR